MGQSRMLFASPPGPMNLRVCAQRGESLEAGGFVASAKQVLDLVPVNQRMCLCSGESSCCFSHSVVSHSLQPMGSNLPGSSVPGIFQDRILEWVAIVSSRESS